MALAKCCFEHNIGAKVVVKSNLRLDALLFGESRPLVFLSFAQYKKAEIKELCHKHEVCAIFGETGGLNLVIHDLLILSGSGIEKHL